MVKMVIHTLMLQQEMCIKRKMELGGKSVILEDLKENKVKKENRVKKETKVKMVRTVELRKLK